MAEEPDLGDDFPGLRELHRLCAPGGPCCPPPALCSLSTLLRAVGLCWEASALGRTPRVPRSVCAVSPPQSQPLSQQPGGPAFLGRTLTLIFWGAPLCHLRLVHLNTVSLAVSTGGFRCVLPAGPPGGPPEPSGAGGAGLRDEWQGPAQPLLVGVQGPGSDVIPETTLFERCVVSLARGWRIQWSIVPEVSEVVVSPGGAKALVRVCWVGPRPGSPKVPEASRCSCVDAPRERSWKRRPATPSPEPWAP